MRTLPLDYARCLGRASIDPQSEVCYKREDCLRWISLYNGSSNGKRISFTAGIDVPEKPCRMFIPINKE